MLSIHWSRIGKDVEFIEFSRDGVDRVHEQARQKLTDMKSIKVFVLMKLIPNCEQLFKSLDTLEVSRDSTTEEIIDELYILHKKVYSD